MAREKQQPSLVYINPVFGTERLKTSAAIAALRSVLLDCYLNIQRCGVRLISGFISPALWWPLFPSRKWRWVVSFLFLKFRFYPARRPCGPGPSSLKVLQMNRGETGTDHQIQIKFCGRMVWNFVKRGGWRLPGDWVINYVVTKRTGCQELLRKVASTFTLIFLLNHNRSWVLFEVLSQFFDAALRFLLNGNKETSEVGYTFKSITLNSWQNQQPVIKQKLSFVALLFSPRTFCIWPVIQLHSSEVEYPFYTRVSH